MAGATKADAAELNGDSHISAKSSRERSFGGLIWRYALMVITYQVVEVVRTETSIGAEDENWYRCIITRNGEALIDTQLGTLGQVTECMSPEHC